ncbi:MAG: S1C family serine protease [Candidatus Bathyarchaeia archaeon]
MSNENFSQVLQSVSNAIAEVAEKVAPSVVRVGSGNAGGTGIIWSPDGQIMTCNHVLDRYGVIDVGLPEGHFDAKVIGRDRYSDIALLKIEANGLKPIELDGLQEPKTGQFVLAFANPFGQRPSVTSGIVTNPRTSIRGWWGTALENVIVTDARLNPGYSGGPLVDAYGKMIGLNTAYVSSRGIAIPTGTSKNTADRLAREGKIKRAYLGITSNPLTFPKEISSQPQINQEQGLIILKVEPESPAKRAGLAIGDIIIRFNQESVANHYDLHRLLTEENIEKSTTLSVLRGEKLTELTIKPVEAQ